MKILPEPLEFEWDKGNQDKNFRKHKVTNKESEEAFENAEKFLHKDEKHSTLEQRYMLWGATKNGRQLSIIFTLRDSFVRVISARDMNKKERRAYEKIKKDSTL